MDYESFLREAGMDDGDAREIAEHDLRLAARDSEGLLMLDSDKRSGLLLRVRLRLDGGAAWLFKRLGEVPPNDERARLADFFMQASHIEVVGAPGWSDWCGALARQADEGGSIQPFRRDDPDGNLTLLEAVIGVLRWRGESLIRFASSKICGNSKTLELLESRLLSALQAIRRDPSISLEDFGILRKPRELAFHGPLSLEFRVGGVDFSTLPGPASLSETNLIEALRVATRAAVCVTVENEEVFVEIAKRNPGWLVVHTSFPGSAVRRFFRMLEGEVRCLHFGDSDPAGFDILRALREKTGRNFEPVCMEFRDDSSAPPLTADERKTLDRLLAMPVMEDVHPLLRQILSAGSKGAFEQENVPVEELLERVSE